MAEEISSGAGYPSILPTYMHSPFQTATKEKTKKMADKDKTYLLNPIQFSNLMDIVPGYGPYF